MRYLCAKRKYIMKLKSLFLSVVLAVIGSSNMMAQKIVAENNTPKYQVTLPDNGKADGRAVILCPGGGYNHLASKHEGYDWIPFFTKRGIAVIVLEYRLPDGNKEFPLGDLRTTMRDIKAHAKEWKINPNGIGVMGFSAGGHLASTFATHEKGALKPAFQILLYPVIMLNTAPHKGMSDKFLGRDATMQLRNEYSSNLSADINTPPAFIALADDDNIIDPSNSINYYTALHRLGISASMFIYKSGGHGFGCKPFAYHEQLETDLDSWLKTTIPPKENAKHIACIGNSITYGAGLKDRNKESYPAQLQQLLGNDYEIRNFGLSGRTLTSDGFGYMKERAWKRVLDYQPDIVFIKLGTNDSQPKYWKGKEAFERDAQAMIDTLKLLSSSPRIIILTPIKSYRNSHHIDDSLVVADIIPLWRKLVMKNKLELLDLHPLFDGKPEMLRDGVHPTKEGDTAIANALSDYLKKK